MRKRRGIVAAGAAVMTCALAGCGWTSRDQFLVDRSVTVQSQPGDGSERYTPATESRFRPAAATIMAERHGR